MTEKDLYNDMFYSNKLCLNKFKYLFKRYIYFLFKQLNIIINFKLILTKVIIIYFIKISEK